MKDSNNEQNNNTPNSREPSKIDDKNPKESTAKFLNDNLRYQQIHNNKKKRYIAGDDINNANIARNEINGVDNNIVSNGENNQFGPSSSQDKSKGKLKEEPNQAKVAAASKAGSDIGSKAGTAVGAVFGGKLGAKIGSKIGSKVGSFAGSKVGAKNGKGNNLNNRLSKLPGKGIPPIPNFQAKSNNQQVNQEEDNDQNDSSNPVTDNLKSGVSSLLKGKSKKLLKGVLIKALPVVAISIIAIIVIIIVMAVLMAVFGGIGGVSSTDAGLEKIDTSVQYCNTVNLSYNGTITTISDDEYIAYEIANSKVKNIKNRSVIMAISIIYRTNLYADTANINNKVCNVTLDKEYKAPENDDYLDYTKETTNKVFAFQQNKLTILPYNEYFSWKEIYSDSTGAQYYRSFIDGDGRFQYEKKWIDKNVPLEMMNQDSSQTYGFSFYGATFIAENNPMEVYDFLLYYYYVSVTKDQSKQYGQIYLIDKSGDSSTGEGIYTGVCSNFDIHATTLSEADFTKKLQEAASKNGNLNIFYKEASQIYKLATSNNVNPELVVVRAEVEGFSPGASKNNYWGIGCVNNGGYAACSTYSSFDSGVVGFINIVKKYSTAQELMGKYAYIGSHWFSPGDSANGGCYYFEYIKKYMSAERASTVSSACSFNCSGDSCLATTAEDQLAYTTWQVADKMIPVREKIFGIGAEDCSEGGSTVTGTGSGAEVARYAVATFDSYHYSQSLREQEGYVDCSSMVARAYKHFGLIIYAGGDNTSGEYTWCKNNNKLISLSELQAGDLIFFNSGYHYDPSQTAGIGHVTMYIGNNQQFSARSSSYAYPDQVAITSYYGDGNIFCRPYK